MLSFGNIELNFQRIWYCNIVGRFFSLGASDRNPLSTRLVQLLEYIELGIKYDVPLLGNLDESIERRHPWRISLA